MSEEQYRRAVAHERMVALAYVGVRLDALCARNGLPLGWWRR